jgi:hypothetical protein
LEVVVTRPSAHKSVANISMSQGQCFEIYVEADTTLSNLDDGWIFLLAPACMKTGENLHVKGRVTQSALNASQEIQNQLLLGHTNFKKISITSDEIIPDHKIETASNRRGGSFFSGGVDSTYTALVLGSKSSLVSVWGFDIPSTDERHWILSLKDIKQFSSAHGYQLIVVKTNLREFSNQYLDWGFDYFGSALGGVACLLSKQLSVMHIPGSFKENYVYWGSFPTLDASFSTSYQQILDHGLETRIAKVHYLSQRASAVAIRVCWQNKQGHANCGTCSKCKRTRLEFHIVNAKHRPAGLEALPTWKELVGMTISKTDLILLRENLSWAKTCLESKTVHIQILVTIARIKTYVRSKVVGIIPRKIKNMIRSA